MASRYFRSGAWFQLAMRKIKTPLVNELVSMKNFVEGLARLEKGRWRLALEPWNGAWKKFPRGRKIH